MERLPRRGVGHTKRGAAAEQEAELARVERARAVEALRAHRKKEDVLALNEALKSHRATPWT